MLYSFARLVLILIFKSLFYFKVEGAENIPPKGGFILASNHTSYLDPLVLGSACRRKLNFMARDNLFSNPIFSSILSAVGAFPVKRNSADLGALKEAMRRLKKGLPLTLFPEGSRQGGGVFSKDPQPGIGFLAAKLEIPVVPAFIKGTQAALPRGAKFIRRAKISVYFGKQINIERRLPYQDIALAIMKGIEDLSC